MTILPVTAEDCNGNPTATPNSAAILKSTSKTGSVAESGCEDPKKKHSFSKTVAEFRLPNGTKLGHSGAIVLKYLAFKVREHGELLDGKKWARVNLDKISSQYPYLGRSTIDDAIARLITAGACEHKNLNRQMGRRRFDRTRCYHVPKRWIDMAYEEIRYFDSDVAKKVRVPAAVIYANFMHWIAQREENEEEQVVPLFPADLVTLLPFSDKTIDRAIVRLVEQKMIVPVADNPCHYCKGCWEAAGSKPDQLGSKPDMAGSKPDVTGSKADNNSIVGIVSVLKESSKTEASPLSENSLDVQKQHDASDHSVIDASTIASRVCSDRTQDTQLVALMNWPAIHSLEELHEVNRAFTPLAQQYRDSDLVPLVEKCADTFFRAWSPRAADDLYDEASHEEIFDAIVPAYQRVFNAFPRDSALRRMLYYGTLEAILGAFLWPRDRHDSYSHPIHQFIRVSYRLRLFLWQRAEERRIKSVEQEFAQRHEEYRSIDAHLEDRSDLTPAEKTRVFKQGLYSRNKIGGIHFDQIHRTAEIKGINTKASASIRRIFALNESLTAGELLRVMDGCLKLHRTQPAPKEFRRGVRWHARMGVNLLVFARNLSAIQKQLGMGSGPVTLFLADRTDQEPGTLAA